MSDKLDEMGIDLLMQLDKLDIFDNSVLILKVPEEFLVEDVENTILELTNVISDMVGGRPVLLLPNNMTLEEISEDDIKLLLNVINESHDDDDETIEQIDISKLTDIYN